MKPCVPLRHGDSTIRREIWLQANPEQPRVIVLPTPEEMHPASQAIPFRFGGSPHQRFQSRAGSNWGDLGLFLFRGACWIGAITLSWATVWLIGKAALWGWRFMQ